MHSPWLCGSTGEKIGFRSLRCTKWYTILGLRLDRRSVIIPLMSSTMGKGTAFASIPVFVLEGGMTLPAKLPFPRDDGRRAHPPLADRSRADLLHRCPPDVGQKIAVADMLPAVLPAAAAAYLPWPF